MSGLRANEVVATEGIGTRYMHPSIPVLAVAEVRERITRFLQIAEMHSYRYLCIKIQDWRSRSLSGSGASRSHQPFSFAEERGAVSPFTGEDDVSVPSRIQNIENTAVALEWNPRQFFVYGLLAGRKMEKNETLSSRGGVGCAVQVYRAKGL